MRGATVPGNLFVASPTTSEFWKQLPTENLKKERAPWAERTNTARPSDTIAFTADAGIEGSE
eukprot:11482927-Alexandrium_andersonii.AAC.1